MAKKPIAVLGGGNGGQCMAADLTLAGWDVNLCELPAFAESFRPVLDSGRIELTGVGRTGTAEIHMVTLDVAEAIRDAEFILVAIPAIGHDAFFEAMLPALTDEHVIVLWPGNYGSFRLNKLLSQRGVKIRPVIVEASTLPYGTRLTGPGQVDLLLTAPEIAVSALPATGTEKVLPRLREMYPVVCPAQNVLATAFSNPNPVVHPVASLLNTGAIQYARGKFRLYREGITEAVARAIRAVYDETAALAEALGFEVLTYRDSDFQTTASIMGVAFQAPSDTIGVIAGIVGPKSLNDRYLVEDIPFGLVPLSEFAGKLNVPVPLIDAVIDLGSVVCGEDYRRTGRTLADLGLADHSAEEIMELVKTG